MFSAIYVANSGNNDIWRFDAKKGVFMDVKLSGKVMFIDKDRHFSKLGRLRYLKVQ